LHSVAEKSKTISSFKHLFSIKNKKIFKKRFGRKKKSVTFAPRLQGMIERGAENKFLESKDEAVKGLQVKGSNPCSSSSFSKRC